MKKYILFEEYITLGQVLKELGLISTGGQAKIFLAENEGNIFYNVKLKIVAEKNSAMETYLSSQLLT
ncbi:RNA-binding S4 domain-containing protein [Lactococcus cremoris]